MTFHSGLIKELISRGHDVGVIAQVDGCRQNVAKRAFADNG